MNKRRTYRQTLSTAALASLLALGMGCDGEEKAKPAPPEKAPPAETPVAPPPVPPKAEAPAEAKASVTGKVEQVMAIGGETTGWHVGTTEVTAVPALKDLVGKQVCVTGTWVEKAYVERGPVRILKVETVEEVK